jgi:hypothetical protein
MTAMRDSVFISYRREDSRDAAGRLAQTLKGRFGDGKVFFDTESIGGGEPFPERLKTALGGARVALVVMGKGWLSAADEYARRRIDDSGDWVRQEIATALAAEGAVVIPVLLDGMRSMPPAEALPEAIAALSKLNLMRLEHARFKRDAEDIAGRIHELGVPFARATEPPPPEPEPRERLLRDYCASVVNAHRHLPGLFSEHVSDIDNVYVELELAPDRAAKGRPTAVRWRKRRCAMASTAGSAGSAGRARPAG